MTRHIEFCDFCEQELSTPAYVNEGQIHFDGLTFRYSTGDNYVSKQLTGSLDFCNLTCFQGWLKKLSK